MEKYRMTLKGWTTTEYVETKEELLGYLSAALELYKELGIKEIVITKEE